MHTLQVFFYMATIPYTKPAKSYIDQLSHLRQMGLIVKNDKRRSVNVYIIEILTKTVTLTGLLRVRLSCV